jgi:hypothetical protein
VNYLWGGKLLWLAVAIFIIAQAFSFPAANIVAAVLAIIGIILLFLDK